MELGILRPDAVVLAAAVLADLVFGDPQWRWHPIRAMGASAAAIERRLRAAGFDGYGGGIALGTLMAALWCGASSLLLLMAARASPWTATVVQVGLVYSLLSLHDLVRHAWLIEEAARGGDLPRTRYATSMFVARDTAALDLASCRRAGIESLSENLTDGVVSPLFWYAVGGLPGMVAFKVASTLDSMVGNRSARYLRFGWFSARLDDALNWLPARATWLLIVGVALVVPRCSARRALAVGWSQHATVPGPNSGWSEAATAGAIRRRLVGPIVKDGRTVTHLWIGDGDAPAAGESERDVPRAIVLVTAAGIVAALLCIAAVALCFHDGPVHP